MKFDTKVVHSNQEPEEPYFPVSHPIFQTSNFAFKSVEHAQKTFSKGPHFPRDMKGEYVYTRGGNPTQRALEMCVADLEGGEEGLSFSSGMAAITSTLITFLKKGDKALATDTVYGETFLVFDKILRKFGIETSFVDTSNLEETQKLIEAIKPKIVYIETPANPTLKISDIKAISEMAHQFDSLVIVDNTFMSPYFQNPLKLGADIVIHSATKYLAGHSDVLGGIVVSNSELISEIRETLFTTGAVLDPFAAWLILRGIKTLSVRMERHQKNAMKVAKFLEEHEKVDRVFYPGLDSHPQHNLAKKQMKGFGGMISFELKDGYDAGVKLMNNVKLCTLAVSLGAVETLIEHPASMTHSMIPREERLKAGITDGLVRISVGIEDVEDIIEDLSNALEKV
ncbi:MAG: PLP-dependent transferase [Candidatus Aenigmarchaeota archaeon]|nr:PLP-dependent transferase [Candidatus Aenigmarchaeota archaeon]